MNILRDSTPIRRKKELDKLAKDEDVLAQIEEDARNQMMEAINHAGIDTDNSFIKEDGTFDYNAAYDSITRQPSYEDKDYTRLSTTDSSASSDANENTFTKFVDALDMWRKANNNPLEDIKLVGEGVSKGISLLDPNGDKALLTEEQKTNYANNNLSNLDEETINELKYFAKSQENTSSNIMNYFSAATDPTDPVFVENQTLRLAEKDMEQEQKKKALEEKLGVDEDTFKKYVASANYLQHLDKRKKQQEEIASYGTAGMIGANTADILLSPIRSLTTGLGYLNEYTNPYRDENFDIDHNAPGFEFSNLDKDVTNQTSKNIDENVDDEVGKFALNTLYQGGKSGIESLLRLATVGEVGTIAEAGLESYDNAREQAQERGLTKNQAIETAVAQGMSEAAWEVLPVHNLWNIFKGGTKAGMKSALKEVAKQGAFEGLEEVETDLTNMLTDAMINKDKSEFNTSIQNYVNQGMSEEDAFSQTLKDKSLDMFQSFLGGAIGGIGGAGVGVSTNAVVSNQASKGLEGNYQQVAQSIPDNVEDYKDEEAYNKAMEVKQKAEELSEQDNVSGKDRRQLLQDIYSVNESMPNVDLLETINENAPFVDVNGTKVRKNDITSQEVAESMASAARDNNIHSFVEAYRDSQASSDKEARTTGQQYFNTLSPKFSSYDLGDTEIQNAMSMRSADDIYNAISNGEDISETEVNTPRKLAAAMAGIQNYEKSEIEQAQKTINPEELHNIETTDNKKLDISDLTIDKQGNFVEEKEGVVIPRKNISNNSVQQFMFNALNQPTQSAKQLYIDSYDGSIPVGSYNNAFTSAYNAGKLNSNNFKGWLKSKEFYAKSIPESTLEAFYNEGAKQVENKSKKVTKVKKKGTGKVTVEKGVENTPIHKLAEAFAKKTGIDIEIRDGSILVTDDSQNALKDSEGNEIYSNGQFQADISKVILGVNGKEYQTFMHEAIGEVLEAYNPEDMADIQDTILNYLLETKGDKYVDEVIKKYQRLYKEAEGTKSYRDAANEMINDTLVGLFTTDKGANDFVNWCTKNDKTVLEKITDFIQAIINKLKSLISDANLSSTAKNVAKMSEKQAQEIRDRLFKAMDKAIDNYKGAEEGKSKDKTSYSLKIPNIEEAGYVEFDSKLTEAQQQYFKDSKVIDENGDLLPVYHGTGSDFTVFDEEYARDSEDIVGFFFSADKEEASGYGSADEYYLLIENPADYDTAYDIFHSQDRSKSGAGQRTREALIDMGYDGVIAYDETSPDYTEYIAFFPYQIKRTDNENPTYDDDVRFSLDVDSEGEKLSEGQKKFFDNSKATDIEYEVYEGETRLANLYHGTVREFYTFDKDYASVEGNVGAGFYFTNDISDVERNYANEEGADLTNKIEREADILEGWGDYEDLSHEEIVEKLRKKYITSEEPIVLEVYLNIQNPVYITTYEGKESLAYSDLGRQDTLLFTYEDLEPGYDVEDFESEEEYQEEVDAFIEGELQDIIYQVDNSEEIAEVVYDAFYEGGITFEELKKRLNNLYLEDEEGNLNANEVARQLIEALGYDGIIDYTPYYKFRNMGVQSTTTHYIVFNSNQAKATSNENPTDNADIRYSLDTEGNELTEQQQKFFKDSKVRDEQGRLKVMYHGTANRFYVYDNDKIGDNYNGWLQLGNGFYFTDDRKVAKGFAKTAAKKNNKGLFSRNVQTVYLNLVNPYIVGETQEDDVYELDERKALTIDRNKLIKLGYDGIIYKPQISSEPNQYVAFNSNQIKEVTNTNPTESEDIRYSLTTDNVREYTLEPNSIYSQYEVSDIWDSEDLLEKSDAEENAKIKQIANLINDKDVLSFEVTQKGNKNTIFVSENTRQGEGKYRATWFDDKGAISHVSRDNAEELAQEILNNLSIDKPINIKAYREGDNDFRYSLDVPTTYSIFGEDLTDEELDSLFVGEERDQETRDTKDTFTSIIKAANKTLQFNYTNKQVEDIADKVINEYNSSVDRDFVVRNLKNIFDAMFEYDNYDDMVNALMNLSEEIVSQSKNVNPEEQRLYEDFLNSIPQFNVSESAKREAEYIYGKWQIAQQKISRFYRKDASNTLDESWSEIVQSAAEHGYDLERFTPDTNQIPALIDAIEKLEPKSTNTFEGADITDMALTTSMNIMQDFYEEALQQKNADANLKDVKNNLKKQVEDYKKVIGRQYQEKVKEITDQLNKKDRELAQLRGSNADLISQNRKYVIENTAAKKAQADRTSLNEYLAKQEKMHQKEQIKKTGYRLIRMLENPTKTKYVPEVLQQPLIEMLSAIDFISYTSKGNVYKGKTNEMWQQKFVMMQDILAKLQALSEVEDLSKSDLFKNNAQRTVIYNIATQMSSITKGFFDEFYDENKDKRVKISSLDAEELKKLNKFMKALSANINNAQSTFNNGRYKDIDSLSEAAISDMKELKAPLRTKGAKASVNSFLKLSMAEAVTYYDMLGSASSTVFDELQDGLLLELRRLQEAEADFIKAKKDLQLEDSKISKWANDIKNFKVSEGELRLNIPQIMYLYALYPREQAKKHIIFGGVKATELELDFSTKKKNKDYARQVRPIHLKPSDVDKITDVLSDKQKALADFMVEYLSTTVSDWGNNVSRVKYGLDFFTESHYMPIITDSNTNLTNVNNANQNVTIRSLANKGFTKELMQDANNPIMLDDIFKVFSQHVADMAQYEGYVLAIDDAIRFYNHETVEAGFANIENQEGMYRNGASVKEEIERVLGTEGKQYFIRLIEDLNRSKQSQSDFKFTDKFFSRNKAQAVLANSRVVAQQPTAYLRAGEVISYKYLSKAASLNPATLKKYSDLSKEQSSLAWYKSKGYYETFIGQDIQEIITGTAKLKDRINDAMGWAASFADDLTWGMLYRASMLKVEDSKAFKNGKLEKNSEEYFDKVNKIFHEIIIKTQVVDTTLTKSQVMRNQDGASKLLTSFGAEPTKSFNILLRGFADGQQGKGWKRFKRAVGVYVYTNLLVSIVTSIVDAWRDNEDDDEFYLKILRAWLGDYSKADNAWDYVQAFFKANLVENLNPINLIPVAREISTAISGYDNSNMSTAVIYQVIDSIKELANPDSKLTWYGKANKAATALSMITGVPIASAMREIKDLYNNVNNLWDGDNIVKRESTTNPVVKAIDKGENISEVAQEQKQTKLQEALEKGNSQKEAESSAKSSVASSITSKYKDQLVELKDSDINKANELKQNLIQAYVAIGYNRSSAEKKINNWFK